jgi:hypothetical protein
MSKAEAITNLLKNFKERHPQIEACMVAKKGLEGVIIFPPTFKDDVSTVWEPLSNNINDMLALIPRYSVVGLKRAYTEILGYGVLFNVLAMSDTALIVFLKTEKPLEELPRLVEDMDETRDNIINASMSA